MSKFELGFRTVMRTVCVVVGVVGAVASVQPSSAKTPDGAPPSKETVCDGLSGAAFGSCNAYCEAQDCDVRQRPSCDALRRNFAKQTGLASFPCDASCGDGKVNQTAEQCDPPGTQCANGRVCTSGCTCPVPVCGDGIVDSGEECDRPGTPCSNGRTCTSTCTCPVAACGDGIVDPGEQCDPPGKPCNLAGGTCIQNCVCQPALCCECVRQRSCANDVPLSDCIARGCLPRPAGYLCGSALPFCVPPPTVCCQCFSTNGGQSCSDMVSSEDCVAQGCSVVDGSCDGDSGQCAANP